MAVVIVMAEASDVCQQVQLAELRDYETWAWQQLGWKKLNC
jgi:hypothetical protein